MSKTSVTVSEKLENYGQTNTNVHVVEGGRLIQHGQLNGDVIVDRGGSLEQHGQVNGNVHAHGRVLLWGQVNGEVHAYPGGELLIAEGVMVGRHQKRYVGPDGSFHPIPASGTVVTQVGPSMWLLTPDGKLSQR